MNFDRIKKASLCGCNASISLASLLFLRFVRQDTIFVASTRCSTMCWSKHTRITMGQLKWTEIGLITNIIVLEMYHIHIFNKEGRTSLMRFRSIEQNAIFVASSRFLH